MFNLDFATMTIGVITSVIGIGYCSYGRKSSAYYLLSGLALLIYPYFVENFWAMLGIGIVLIVAPYLLDR